MDVDTVVAEVAGAVGLAEGEAGIRDILSAVLHAEPAAVREVSRRAEIPVPIVAAACNELRKRGVIDNVRPVKLTPAGRAALAAGLPGLAVQCTACGGTGEVLPGELAGLADRLEQAGSGRAAAKPELDQSYATVQTNLRRVLRLQQANALAGQRIVLLGDDDLVSVAIAAVAARSGRAGSVRRLTVLDTDPDVLGRAGQQIETAGLAQPAELVRHDLRQPLPEPLAGAFDVALTDPPYTVAGAELFLSRAVAALSPGGGRHVFFSFGPRRPEETVAVQRAIAAMGLAVRSLTPGFNSYLGAGILAGTSHLYHLRSTAGSEPLIVGGYDGPLYTAQSRSAATRPYRCAQCRGVHPVGPGAKFPTIAALQAAGCADCGGTVFRPMPLRQR